MWKFIAKRSGAGLVLLLAITLITFVLLHLSSGDIARTILGTNATEAQLALKREELGLDRSVMAQYLDWLTSALRGDLGHSYFTTDTVTTALANRIPVTLGLVISIVIVSGIFAWALGLSAAYLGGWIDKTIQSVAVIANAIPGFLVALLFVTVFAVSMRLFPASGYVPFLDSPAGWLSTMTLPILALSLGSVASIAQQVRGGTIAVLQLDYVRTLRARGLSERGILLRHVLRNASVPGLAALALNFVSLLGGSVLVEQVFALPGLGTMAITYSIKGDIPVVMGLLVVYTAFVIIVNLLFDLVIVWANPKADLA